jgi:hypothetical protein
MTTKTKIQLNSKRGAIPLERYAGKWVAFIGKKVVAWADTLEALMAKVKKMRLEKKTSVFLVPRKDEGPYILQSFRAEIISFCPF